MTAQQASAASVGGSTGIDQLKADLAAAKKRHKAITGHRDRLQRQGLTQDRWLDARHHEATLEVNRLTAQVAALKSGFAGAFA